MSSVLFSSSRLSSCPSYIPESSRGTPPGPKRLCQLIDNQPPTSLSSRSSTGRYEDLHLGTEYICRSSFLAARRIGLAYSYVFDSEADTTGEVKLCFVRQPEAQHKPRCRQSELRYAFDWEEGRRYRNEIPPNTLPIHHPHHLATHGISALAQGRAIFIPATIVLLDDTTAVTTHVRTQASCWVHRLIRYSFPHPHPHHFAAQSRLS